MKDELKITDQDVRCMKSAVKLLVEEGFAPTYVNPKKNLLKKLERMAESTPTAEKPHVDECTREAGE